MIPSIIRRMKRHKRRVYTNPFEWKGEDYMKKKTATYGWLALIIAFITSIYFNSFLGNQQGLLLEPICTDLDMPRTLYSSMMSIAALSNAVLSFLFPTAYKKLGLKAMAVIGAIGAVAFCGFYMLGGMFVKSAAVMFALGQICFGCTCAWATLVTSTTLINNWFAKNRGTLISITATLTGVGSVVAAPLVSSWIAKTGWSNSMLIRGVFGIAVVIFFIVALREKPGENDIRVWEGQEEDAYDPDGAATVNEENSGFTLQELMHTKNFWFCLITTAGIGLFIYPAFVCLAANVSDLGYAANVGTVMSVVYITNIIVTLPLGGLMEKLGCRIVMLVMFVLVIICLAILSMHTISLTLVYIAAAIMGVAYATFQVPIAMLASEIAGTKSVVQTQSYFYTAMTAGMIFGVPLFNVIYDAAGSYHLAFLIDIACVIGMCVCIILGTSKIDRSKLEAKMAVKKKAN